MFYIRTVVPKAVTFFVAGFLGEALGLAWVLAWFFTGVLALVLAAWARGEADEAAAAADEAWRGDPGEEASITQDWFSFIEWGVLLFFTNFFT